MIRVAIIQFGEESNTFVPGCLSEMFRPNFPFLILNLNEVFSWK